MKLYIIIIIIIIIIRAGTLKMNFPIPPKKDNTSPQVRYSQHRLAICSEPRTIAVVVNVRLVY